jgi:uncharacterized membrane protein YedE/YeeE
MEFITLTRWSPYIVGAGIGILIWFSFLLSNRPIGCSTAYVRASGFGEKLINGQKVKTNQYYSKYLPEFGWEVVLLGGVIIGALVSSAFSGNLELELVPGLWKEAFGTTQVFRSLTALFGGFLLGFGARFAGGCTSGHGISGTLQLAVSSWLALISFFFGGSLTAFVLYILIGGI